MRNIFQESWETKILRKDFKITLGGDMLSGLTGKYFKEAINKLPDEARFLKLDISEFDDPIIIFRQEIKDDQ